MNINHGELKHLTLLHIYTNYKITNKDISDMTVIQYQAIIKITDEIIKFKQKNKAQAVV